LLALIGEMAAYATEAPMTQVGVGETTEVCEECGAVVGDRERHAHWHERLATLLPDQGQ
jgi:hypothetical protein